jgi:hypothetical protein
VNRFFGDLASTRSRNQEGLSDGTHPKFTGSRQNGANIRIQEALMIRLLMFSLVLSTPLVAAQTATVPDGSHAVELPLLTLMHHGTQVQMAEEQHTSSNSFDAVEVRPESDICYKIRAYIFSQGSHPKLLRETTCGPKAPEARQTDGFKPQLVPLDITVKPAAKQ